MPVSHSFYLADLVASGREIRFCHFFPEGLEMSALKRRANYCITCSAESRRKDAIRPFEMCTLPLLLD